MNIPFLKGAGIIFGIGIIFFLGYQKISHNNVSIPVNVVQIENQHKDESLFEEEINQIENNTSIQKKSTKSSLITIHETIIDGNLNNLIEISGSGVENIAYIHIGGVNFTPIKNENKYYIALNKNTFISGEYFIIINYKNSSIETLEEKLKVIFYDTKVSISSFHPNIITNKKDSYITVIGTGFDKVISVQLNNNIILKKTDFKIIQPHALAILIPKDLPIGDYYLNIMTTESVYELPEIHFTIFQ